MTDRPPATPGQPGFVRGNERLDQLLADPQLAADVAAAHADAEEMDRVYAMNLAMIRKAAQMTQAEVARKLGVGQAVVSRLEHRGDMLLSTLYDYLMATGADGAGIVVTVHGQRIELDLSPTPQPARTARPPEPGHPGQGATPGKPRGDGSQAGATADRQPDRVPRPPGPARNLTEPVRAHDRDRFPVLQTGNRSRSWNPAELARQLPGAQPVPAGPHPGLDDDDLGGARVEVAAEARPPRWPRSRSGPGRPGG